MSRSGLQPRGTYCFSLENNTFKNNPDLAIPLPNLSGELHSIVRQYMDFYGLGKRCLLLSESNDVKTSMQKHFTNVEMVTSDYYPVLMKDNGVTPTVDCIWDICSQPPAELLQNPFDSILCQALLEHVIAPTTAIANLFALCAPNGRIFILTCTPSFHYHQFPRDYVRFHHDYFEDMPLFLEKHFSIKSQLLEMYSFEGIICVCYRKK